MTEHRYQTSIVLRVGDAEASYDATVIYARHRGYAGDRTDPPELASCEVLGITLDFTKTRRIALDELVVAELADELQPELLADWHEDDLAAADARAEARRDDAMLERL